MASSSKFDTIDKYNEYLIENNKTDVTIKDYIEYFILIWT